ncbi:MAG: hypothetical protein OES32_06315 [Acidobacteriota bacterium]|nr:hypothetical protein [Acidobacteriota bacterium]MDH3523183.1 hypothetical protein [Acidobacteriota bacterium]
MRKHTFIITLAVLALAATGTAFAAAGGSCNEAILVQAGTFADDLGGANSKWYSYDATGTGNIPINTSLPGTQFETRLVVFGACGGAPVAESSGGGGRLAHVLVAGFPGQRFFIEVSKIGGSGSQFELAVDDKLVGPCGQAGTGGCFIANGTPFCDDTCGGPPCPGCCTMICAADPFCCDTAWDQICADAAQVSCVVVPVELKNFEIDG